jgi:hypothetical protein
MRKLTPGFADWPQPSELKPFEGRRVRLVIRHQVIREWADNGEWTGELVSAHADWWTCLLRLADGTRKFLDLRNVVEWEVSEHEQPALLQSPEGNLVGPAPALDVR